MDNDATIARYRRWYRHLLGLHSQAYRERFAEGMEQTFVDLCRERSRMGGGLAGVVVWMFLETSLGIVRERARGLAMSTRMLRIALGVGLFLLIPLYCNFNVEGWNWGPLDFVFAFGLLFGTCAAYDIVSRKGGTLTYRLAVGLALLAGFLLFWINAAVGIIGDEELANALYLGVLVVAVAGALIARFEPRGMSRAMVAAAVVQLLVPLVALAWVPAERFTPGIAPVFGLNGVFVACWLISALLFWRGRNSVDERQKAEVSEPLAVEGIVP
jgi:hypothetical protein